MTHLLNQTRVGLRFHARSTPYMVTAPAFQSLPEATFAGTAEGGATRGPVLVHVLQCDCQKCDSPTHRHKRLDAAEDGTVTERIEETTCAHETHNEAIPDHESYVPDGWAVYPDGTHKCPDCRTKRSLERESKQRAELIKQGVSVEELRARLAAFHAEPLA